jgi:hypothetical protein
VSGNGAYQSGMDEQVTLFDRAVTAAVHAQPDPALGAMLVPRLAATARAATLEAEGRASRRAGAAAAAGARRPRRRWARVAQVAVAVALIPLLMTGLAFAGVTLPGPAQTAFEKVGIHLPNQASDDDSSAPASDRGGPGTAAPDIASGKPGSVRHGKGKKLGAENGRRRHGQGQSPGQGHGQGQGQSGSHGNSANAGNGGQGSGNGNNGGKGNSQGSSNNQTGKGHAEQGAGNGQGNGVSDANPPAHPVPPSNPNPPDRPAPPDHPAHP